MKSLVLLVALCAVLALPLTLALAVHGYDSGSLAVRSTAHEAKLMLWAILGGGLLLAGVVAGGWSLREVVRAWRTPVQLPPERHVIQRETRIVDGRPNVMQLPASTSPWAEVWPELVRSGWNTPQVGQPAHPAQLEAPTSWAMAEDEPAEFNVFDRPQDWH